MQDPTRVFVPPANRRVLSTYEGYVPFNAVRGDDGEPFFGEYTEGKYDGDPKVPYQVAQTQQLDYLLDEVGCGPGSRLLDIGCGNGSLLKRALERGAARAVGITISPSQVAHCRAQGLEAYLVNYLELPGLFAGQFDAVIANGSGEHFCQPEDAIKGHHDRIYEDLFRRVRAVLDPNSPSRRFATTMIHFSRLTDPVKLIEPAWLHLARADRYYLQATVLLTAFGGYYPYCGQLARCAAPFFQLVREEDGTLDYHYTSEEWLRRLKTGATKWPQAQAFWTAWFRAFRSFPAESVWMLLCMLLLQSWMWQFRGSNPPMRLLRHTWTLH